jgi:hypothetical protein
MIALLLSQNWHGGERKASERVCDLLAREIEEAPEVEEVEEKSCWCSESTVYS